MADGSYNIGSEESRKEATAKFMKEARKSGGQAAAEAAKATTLVTPWICSKEELGPERMESVSEFAAEKDVTCHILTNPQVGETTLRLHVRLASSASGSDQPVVVGTDDEEDRLEKVFWFVLDQTREVKTDEDLQRIQIPARWVERFAKTVQKELRGDLGSGAEDFFSFDEIKSKKKQYIAQHLGRRAGQRYRMDYTHVGEKPDLRRYLQVHWQNLIAKRVPITGKWGLAQFFENAPINFEATTISELPSASIADQFEAPQVLVSRSLDDFANQLKAGLKAACASFGFELTTTATVFTAGCESLPECFPEHNLEEALWMVAGDAEEMKKLMVDMCQHLRGEYPGLRAVEVFDARPLKMDQQYFPGGHLGLHPKFGAAYFFDPSNRLWRYMRYLELLALIQSMDAVSSDSNDGILALLSFCHQGKHRSVFSYALIGGILVRLGWKVNEHSLCYFAQQKATCQKKRRPCEFCDPQAPHIPDLTMIALGEFIEAASVVEHFV